MAAPWWWRYAIPNIVTCVSLLAGLLSISSAIAGDARGAAWFILLSVLLDKLDGTAARLLRGSSKFGLQMDSLADLIVFGVAPAVLVLTTFAGSRTLVPVTWPALRELTYVGAFWFVIAAALRLAKFNVVSEAYGRDYFFGIPTTLSGAFVGCAFLVGYKYPALRSYLQALPLSMFILGFLMVSRVPLRKLKPGRTLLGKIWVIGNLVGVYVCGFARLAPEYLLAVCVGYLVIGPIVALARGVRAPKLPRPGEPPAATSGETLAEGALGDLAVPDAPSSEGALPS